MGLPYATLVLIALGCAFILGAALAIRGLRGRRVGDEPHCRRCGYDLTGGPQRCPECGHGAVGKNVVIGVRQRRWLSASIGLALLLVSTVGIGSAISGRAKDVNWYRYAPLFLLLTQAEADNEDAIDELVSRHKDGRVPARRLAKLVPAALERQGTRQRGLRRWAWTDLLAAMDSTGELTDPEREQFRDQMISLTLEFRPRVRQGEEVQVFLRALAIGSKDVAGTYAIERCALKIGEWTQPFHPLAPEVLRHRWGDRGLGQLLPTSQLEPGTHQLELHSIKRFTEPSFSCPFVLTGELTLLPVDSPDTVRLVDDPRLGDLVRRSMSIYRIDGVQAGETETGVTYFGIILNEALPIDVAFDLIARVDGQEQVLGPVILRRAAPVRTTHRYGFRVPDLGANCFDPVLRTHAKPARETPDIVEIWDGEIVFDPICLSGEPANSFANTSGTSNGHDQP